MSETQTHASGSEIGRTCSPKLITKSRPEIAKAELFKYKLRTNDDPKSQKPVRKNANRNAKSKSRV